VRARGPPGGVGEFVDRGISGTKDRRPQLDEMMTRVRRGGVTSCSCGSSPDSRVRCRTS